MANRATKMKEEATAYIGKENAALLETFTDKDWEDLFNLNLDLDKSYFVKGSESKLKKFEAFFLMRCSFEKPLYAHYFLSEYIARAGSLIATDDSEVSFAEKDLLFLYVHNNILGIGNSETWVFTAALNKVTNRNRIGYRTIILSERNISLLSSSPELITVSLGGSVENRDPSAIAHTTKATEGKNDEDTNSQSSKEQQKNNKVSKSGGAY